MKKFLCLLLVVFTMGSMYYFSGQDGVKSKYQSDSVVKIIDKIRDEITLKDTKVKNDYYSQKKEINVLNFAKIRCVSLYFYNK